MIMQNKVSIIVPIYNVEMYLEKCISSILKQTYQNIEVILVNDGSTDNSPSICKNFLNKDNRIVYISQKNCGLSSARNAGLDNATGEWILFVDSDDYLEINMVNELISLALEHSADIVSCNVFNVYENGKKSSDAKKAYIKEFSYIELVKGLLTQEEIRFEVWNKLWKKELISDVRFKIGQISEDIYFDHVVFKRSKKFVYTSKCLYNYLIKRPGNTRSSFKKNKMLLFDEISDWYIDLKRECLFIEANYMAAIGAQFAASIYAEAKRKKQDSLILKKLKARFDYFYTDGKKIRSFKINIFYISPLIYYMFSLISVKVNKL